MIFSRNLYVERLASMRWNGLVKVITGTRRAGKSYLLNELFYQFLLREGVSKEKIIRFAFDSDEDIDRLDAFANGESIKIKDREKINLAIPLSRHGEKVQYIHTNGFEEKRKHFLHFCFVFCTLPASIVGDYINIE